MLAIYGHGNVNARERIAAAWEASEQGADVIPLRKTDNATDISQIQISLQLWACVPPS